MWIINFLKSSIGRKLIMSLTGIFLCLFLVVHLIGNLQLLVPDGGETFNRYAYMMTHNPLIFIIALGNYFFILTHAAQGILISLANKSAKSQKYAVSTNENASWASKNMMILGILVLAFICIHMGDFWFRMKAEGTFLGEGWVPMLTYEGISEPVANLYDRVVITFSQLWIVIVYLIGLIALAFHLNHGFASAFQTLGLNHKKYTPIIKGIGTLYSYLIPIGFAIIPLYVYFTNR